MSFPKSQYGLTHTSTHFPFLTERELLKQRDFDSRGGSTHESRFLLAYANTHPRSDLVPSVEKLVSVELKRRGGTMASLLKGLLSFFLFFSNELLLLL